MLQVINRIITNISLKKPEAEMESLPSKAEQYAEKAENLSPFQGIKVLYVRSQIEQALELFGRCGIFDQYTKHNISHIDEMLKMTDWLIPDETSKTMTKADWLLLVLSFYLHDLGMLVTKKEYNDRMQNSNFVDYKKSIYEDKRNIEYKEKLAQLDDPERFLYQEYVRLNHATRIGEWINGYLTFDNTDFNEITIAIKDLLKNLPASFRRDLSTVCKSHHEDDLYDFNKYKTESRHGTDSQSTANVHYIAIILRTADLLHISSDRTPTIQYQLISPTDPKSIFEWQKQMAVNAILPQKKKNSEGNIDDTLPKDTIEITAFFDRPDRAEAYFGLRSYLEYAESQIKRSYSIIQESIKTRGTQAYQFPWNTIDDTDITTEGFEPKKLQFRLDQESILNLLVGNTLYNDSSVAIRELIQNSIDAISLQQLIDEKCNLKKTDGKIQVIWNSNNRELSLIDNGTGMTLEDIENYLLKVGSSKYRSEEFCKIYPEFSAISRFGIGILTCFMISDNIDITTNSQTEQNANQISIRKVSGKYLLKRISKNLIEKNICQHGTKITLQLRPDIDMKNISNLIRRWVIFPAHKVELIENGKDSIVIGYESPRSALSEFMLTNNIEADGVKYDIHEKNIDGVSMCYAVAYSEYLKEWGFMTIDDLQKDIRSIYSPIGTCIEGIRVESTSPGFTVRQILSIANVTGKNKAQTNVARSAMEINEERNNLLSTCYKIYVSHVQNELDRLVCDGYSLVWASREAQYLIRPILDTPNRQDTHVDRSLFDSELNNLKCIILEKDHNRTPISPNDVMKINEIEIIDSIFIKGAESLLQEVNTKKTISEIITFLGVNICHESKDPCLYNINTNNILHKNALIGKEVSSITVDKTQRRINTSFKGGESIWNSYETPTLRTPRSARENIIVHIPKSDFNINDLDDKEVGIFTFNGIYIKSNTQYYDYINKTLSILDTKNSKEDLYIFQIFLGIITNNTFLRSNIQIDLIEGLIDQEVQSAYKRTLRSGFLETIWNKIDKLEIVRIILSQNYSIYNPREWSRNWLENFAPYN